MPRLVMPVGMPKEVLVIIDVIGNRARTEILRRLADQPLSAVELAAELDTPHASVHRHLKFLEKHGLVRTNVEAGHRVGRPGAGREAVVWSTVPERVQEFGTRWIDYASGKKLDS